MGRNSNDTSQHTSEHRMLNDPRKPDVLGLSVVSFLTVTTKTSWRDLTDEDEGKVLF